MDPTCWRRMDHKHVLLVAAAASLYLSVVMAICVGRSKDGGVITSIKANQNTNNATSALANTNFDGTSTCYFNGKQVCLTAGCARAASMLLENVDFDQDPCDDFYNFACGTFLKKTIIPEDEESVDMFIKVEHMVNEELKIIMEEPQVPDEPRPFRLVKDLYKACMNTSQIEEIGLSEILQLLRGFGGWPVLEGTNWDESSYDWKDNIYKFRNTGISIDYIIKLTVQVDVKNSTKRIIDLDQAELWVDRQNLVNGFDDEIVQAYYKYMVAEAVLLGADKEEAEKELKKSLLFEIDLAKISLSPEERINLTRQHNPMTISQLQQQFPSIQWAEYITKLLAETIELKPDEVINVEVPSYISSLETLLNTTPKRVLANYLQWRAFDVSVSYLPESVRNIELEFNSVIFGITQLETRWSECVDITTMRLEAAVSSLYVQRFFKQDSKSSVVEIVDAIRAEMSKTLTEVDWMDEQTREQAMDKAKAMTVFIGYPDGILVTENLEEFYKKLKLSPDKYLESIMNVRKFKLDFSFSQLRDPYNKSDWRLHVDSTSVNAHYEFQNYVEFSAGILQGVFFSNERPMYLNFAGIGSIIGHEFTHGFDIQASLFNKDGNLENWWDPQTKKLYLEKVDCFIQQYGNYTVEEVGLKDTHFLNFGTCFGCSMYTHPQPTPETCTEIKKVNGITTQAENIADNGGLKEANRAYTAWANKHGEELRLPGFLDYSPQQMFWIGAANVWCSKSRPEDLVLQVNTYEHAPNRFRVIGPFSNRKEFAKDFNCPPGSKMNPVKKCEVW